MTKLFEKREGFPLLSWGEGFSLGMVAILLVSLLIPTKAPAVETVVVPQIIEKEVVVKVPVRLTEYDQRQIQCLAENAYFEAGNQSTKGMIAVTNVVMNRVEDKRFPKTPCGVVNQKSRGVCQFSWVCEGGKRIRNWGLYSKTKKVAEDVYLDNVGDVTHGAKFYHADYVRPSWSRMFDRTTKIGAHIFYRG